MGLRSRIKNRIKRTLGKTNDQSAPARRETPQRAPQPPKSPRAQYAATPKPTSPQPDPLTAPAVSTEAKAPSTKTEQTVAIPEPLNQEIDAQQQENKSVTEDSSLEDLPKTQPTLLVVQSDSQQAEISDIGNKDQQHNDADTESELSDSTEEAAETSDTDHSVEPETAEKLEVHREIESDNDDRDESTDNDSNQENGIDTTGAFAIYGLNRLIPETCPSCGAKTYGNWTRTDDGFACTLCDELY